MEKKQNLLRNMLVVVILAVAILAVLAAGKLAKPTLAPNGGTLATDAPVQTAAPQRPAETEVPAATTEPAVTEVPVSSESAATEPPAVRAYLVVTVGDVSYEPIPLDGTGRFTITRGDHVNVIEVTEDSVRMAEASCDNQDCVFQGTMTLANMEERILQNMIICLPNEVTLFLYTPELLEQALIEIPEETNAP